MTRLVRPAALLALVGLATFAPSASAAMISFNHTTNQTVTPFSDNFTLSGFSSSLGTLTGVTITVNSMITGEIDVQNTTRSDYQFISASESVTITLYNPDGSTTQVTPSFAVNSGTALANSITRFTIPSNTGLTATTNVASNLLSNYINTGSALSFTAGFSGATYQGTTPTGTPGGALLFGGSSLAGGTTTITYTYTPAAVPEPASLALMTLGLGGVGLLARRRRA